MGALEYLPHLIYATALTSTSMHHLFQRKAFEADRAHVAAQLSILSDLQERSKFMSQNIQNIEQQMHNLASARAAMTDQLFTQKMRTLQLEITQRREGLAKINQLIHKMISSGETSM